MKDGVPAFPTTSQNYDGHGVPCSDGMSLRDYFAAHAMNGLIAGDYEKVCESGNPDGIERERQQYAAAIARSAYRYADAMLAEREKNRG
jgi:hypothetical protein